MSMWDEDDGEFRDIPDETQLDHNGQLRAAPQAKVQSNQQALPKQNNHANFNGATNKFEEAPVQFDHQNEYLDEIIENLETEDEDFSSVLNDANLRIEQGRLYQMIMNHDLFDGMDADPRAVKNVQREIRKFAKESMEVMLGMRDKPTLATPASPFNDLEVDILKKIASKATNGASESPEANQVAAAVREVPKKQTLNTIGGSTSLKKAAPKSAAAPRAYERNLPSKPSAPLARQKTNSTVDAILAEEGLTKEMLELDYVGIGKSLEDLTPQELEVRRKQTQARLAKHKTVKSADAIPMASPDQQALMLIQRAEQMKNSPGIGGLKIPGGMSALLDQVKSMPVKNTE